MGESRVARSFGGLFPLFVGSLPVRHRSRTCVLWFVTEREFASSEDDATMRSHGEERELGELFPDSTSNRFNYN